MLISFSLPTQRCFWGSCNGEAADNAFLCLRRGVSLNPLSMSGGESLFSAYAEVFLTAPARAL